MLLLLGCERNPSQARLVSNRLDFTNVPAVPAAE